MAGSRTYYPKFSRALYELEAVMGDTRAKLIKNAGFSTADTTAFDTLKTALDVATLYFPQHTEAT